MFFMSCFFLHAFKLYKWFTNSVYW